MAAKCDFGGKPTLPKNMLVYVGIWICLNIYNYIYMFDPFFGGLALNPKLELYLPSQALMRLTLRDPRSSSTRTVSDS